MDAQSVMGKTPQGVAVVARAAGVPVVAVTGCLGDGFEALYEEGFSAIFPIIDRIASLEDVLAEGASNITRTARNVGAVLALTL